MINLKQGRAPDLFIALLVLTCTMVFGQSQALANITDKTRATGMADAPALIAGSNIPCELVEANYIGESNIKVEGKNLKGKSYELSCKNGPGLILTKTDAGLEPPYNCTQGATFAVKNKGVPQCELASNIPHYKWLQTYATNYLSDCTVDKARLIGTLKTEPSADSNGATPSSKPAGTSDRYEVGCVNSKAFILDLPSYKSDATIAYRNCLMTEGSASACQYQTHEQAINQIKPLGQIADAKCQISNARFIGITADQSGFYYEFGCTNQPGYVVLVNTDGTFDHSVSCTAAKSLGGCQFTTLADAASSETQYYTKALAEAGYVCSVQAFNIIGTQPSTKRDYVEFKCPERPFGLIGFVPQADSQSTVNVSDCFVDKTRKNVCSFIGEDVYRAHIDKLIKVALPTRGCDVNAVRYIGESEAEADGIVLEVACANKRGYIGMLTADRAKITDTVPCKIAKAHKSVIQCEIPGNGTYADND